MGGYGCHRSLGGQDLPVVPLSGDISDTVGVDDGLVDDIDVNDTVQHGISGTVLLPPVGG